MPSINNAKFNLHRDRDREEKRKRVGRKASKVTYKSVLT